MSERKIMQPGKKRVKPAATRLKELAPEDQRAVLEIIRDHTYQEAEPLVEAATGFACSTDVLCRFRKWHEAKEAMEIGQERLRQIAEFSDARMSDVPSGKAREFGSVFYELVSLGRDDVKGFVNVGRLEVQGERERLRRDKLNLEERKFQESLRTKL